MDESPRTSSLPRSPGVDDMAAHSGSNRSPVPFSTSSRATVATPLQTSASSPAIDTSSSPKKPQFTPSPPLAPRPSHRKSISNDAEQHFNNHPLVSPRQSSPGQPLSHSVQNSLSSSSLYSLTSPRPTVSMRQAPSPLPPIRPVPQLKPLPAATPSGQWMSYKRRTGRFKPVDALNKSSLSKPQDPHPFLMVLLSHTLNAFNLTPEVVARIMTMVENESKVKNRSAMDIPVSTLENVQSIALECCGFLGAVDDLRDIVTIQAHWRGIKARRIFNKMKADILMTSLKHRNEAYRELWKKETQYVRNLQTCVNKYLVPLREDPKAAKSGLGPRELTAIFQNIESILNIHMSFYKDLSDLNEKWPYVDAVGDVMMKFLPSLKAYEPYALNFKHAMDTLFAIEKAGLLKKLLPNFSDLTLTALLNQPLNHVSSYELALEQMINHTSADRPEYQVLCTAHAMVQQTSRFLRESQQHAIVANILTRLKNAEGLAKLFHAKRAFIRECAVTFRTDKKFNGVLFLFTDLCLITKTETKAHHKLLETLWLQGAEVKDIPDDLLSLELISRGRRILITFATGAEKAHCLEDLQKHILLLQHNRVFGVPLNDLVARENQPSQIPTIVEKIVSALRVTGMDVEGIFRISGRSTTVQQLKTACDKGKMHTIEFSKESPHDIAAAALLKQWLRELPEPLLTFDLYQPLLDAYEKHQKDGEQKLGQVFRPILEAVPSPNKQTLRYLLKFLRDVSARADKNKMNASNLATCFGSNFLRPKTESIDFALQMTRVNAIVYFLIECYHQLFE